MLYAVLRHNCSVFIPSVYHTTNYLCFGTFSLAGNSGLLTWIRHSRHSSRKSSATHCCQCVQYCGVQTLLYGCQCVQYCGVQTLLYGCQCVQYCGVSKHCYMAASASGVLTCTQMLMHAIAHGGCANTVIESALKADWEKNPVHHRGLEPESVLSWFFS